MPNKPQVRVVVTDRTDTRKVMILPCNPAMSERLGALGLTILSSSPFKEQS